MWIVLMKVLSLIVTTVKAAYHIQDFQKGTTWTNANQSCNLTAPDLKYTSDGIMINLNASDFPINEGESIWLGYVQAFQVFQYVGCATDDAILGFDASVKSLNVPADPALCYSACGSEYFGLKYIQPDGISKCYCLINGIGQTSDTEKQCKTRCTNPTGAACGGKHGGTYYVSLYKHVAEPSLHDNDPDVKCLGYEPSLKKYIWYSCALTYSSMCETDSEVIVMDFADWLCSSVICFEDGQYPVTYRTPLVPNGSTGSPLWTGMIRSGVVFKHNDAPGRLLKIAIMELVKGIFQVRFTGNMSALKNKALCYGDKTGSDTTKAQDSTTDASTGLPLKSSDDESNTGVYVGVSVGIIVLLALAALGFVIWWRRQRAPNQSNKKIGMTGRSNAAYDGVKYGDPNPEIRLRIDHSEDNKLHDYDRIQSVKTKLKPEEDDTYDTTDTKSKGVTMHDTENEYNRLNAVQKDETYNHVGSCLDPKKPIVSSATIADDTYDTSGNLPNKIENRKATHATDNNYSHVNVNSNGKKQTDNVYAKANLLRSDRGVDKGGKQEADPTYDSADHRANTCGVPLSDNMYSHA